MRWKSQRLTITLDVYHGKMTLLIYIQSFTYILQYGWSSYPRATIYALLIRERISGGTALWHWRCYKKRGAQGGFAPEQSPQICHSAAWKGQHPIRHQSPWRSSQPSDRWRSFPVIPAWLIQSSFKTLDAKANANLKLPLYRPGPPCAEFWDQSFRDALMFTAFCEAFERSFLFGRCKKW